MSPIGCDIHSFVERWEPNVGWQWLKGDLFDNTTTYSDGTVLADGEPWEPIVGRWYPLFGFLAGVRDPDVPQIAEVRGLPSDLSPELRKKFGFVFPDDCPHAKRDRGGMRMCACAHYADDLHSHSWLTGAELIGYDYGRMIHVEVHVVASVIVVDEGGDRTLGEYLGEYVQRFHEIAALAENPAHVRMVYAFDS